MANFFHLAIAAAIPNFPHFAPPLPLSHHSQLFLLLSRLFFYCLKAAANHRWMRIAVENNRKILLIFSQCKISGIFG
jgi:hypothetical protein